MQAPFHSMGMMDPRLTTTGFGSYRYVKSGWEMGATLDVLRGNPFTGGTYPVYFPGNGTTEPLTSYAGNEFPDPLQACAGYTAPTGLPIWIQVGGNVSTNVTASSFTANGTSVPHCVIDSNFSALSSYLTSRGGVILIPQQPLLNGVTYKASLTVNGVAYSWSFTVGPLSICTVTDSSAPVSPASIGTKVVLTASSTGCPNPIYEFWILAPGASAYTLAQPYGPTSTFTWNTAGAAAGAYSIVLWVRDASSAGTFGNVSGRWDGYEAQQYTLGAGCPAVRETPSPPSLAILGTTVVFTAAALGCPNPQYEFWILAPGSSAYKLAASYSPTATFSWNTTGAPTGTYSVVAWVRDASSTGAFGNSSGRWDAYVDLGYQLSDGCQSVTDTASPASQSPVGTTVTITASAIGCPNPQYEFWLLAPGAGAYKLAQAYSASQSLAWNTTGAAAGTYSVVVWAKDVASAGLAGNGSGRWDAYAGQQYTITLGCQSLTTTASPASPVLAGSTVTFAAAASGCVNPQYEFWMYAPGTSAYTLAQAYSNTATFTWTTVGKSGGTYAIVAWARDAASAGLSGNSMGRWDAYSYQQYTLRVGCQSAGVVESPASPSAPGTTVQVTATASGCSDPAPLLEFWLLAPGATSWKLVQPYSSGNTWSWSTTGLAPGTYAIDVWVKDAQSSGLYANSAGSWDAYVISSVTLT
jgi:hypothetical protein